MTAWEARPIYAGLRSLGFPGHPLGDLWRAADLLREHRGDSLIHVRKRLRPGA